MMIDVLRSYVAAGKFRLHDFVVMPNHLHLLITVREGMTIEKAMPFIKGGRGLKPRMAYIIAARLKPCPDTEILKTEAEACTASHARDS